MKVRIRNFSDKNPCTRTREFWVDTRTGYAWETRAIVFNYNDARKIAKMFREMVKK